MRRFQPRFNLLVLMLLVACAAIFIQVWIVATETDPTIRTVRTLRYGWASGRRSAAHALGDLGMQAGPSALPALLDAVGDRDESVRFEAVGALGRLGAVPKRITPRLIAALADPSPRVRCAAAIVLGQVFPAPTAAIPDLIECLDDPDRATRAAVVTALGQIGMDPAANPMTRRNPRLIQLPNSSGPEADRLAPRLIAAMSDPDATVRAAAVEALVKVHPPPAVLGPRLAKALTDHAESVRRAAVGTLAGPTNWIAVDIKDVGPALLALLRSGDPASIDAAVPALSNLIQSARIRRDPDLPTFAASLARVVVAFWRHDPSRLHQMNVPGLATDLIVINAPARVGPGAEARVMLLDFLAETMVHDPDDSVRATAASVLVGTFLEPSIGIDPSGIWPAFLRAAHDPAIGVRQSAAVAVRTFAQRTCGARLNLRKVSQLARRIGQEVSAGHWVEAYRTVGQLRKWLEAFGKLRDLIPFAALPDLEMALRDQLEDQDWDVRLGAFTTLATFRRLRTESPTLRHAIREATRVLGRGLRTHKHEEIRLMIARALLNADPRDSDLIRAAVGALRSDPSIRIQARLSDLSERFGVEPIAEPTAVGGPLPSPGAVRQLIPARSAPPAPAPRSGATRSGAGASLPGRS